MGYCGSSQDVVDKVLNILNEGGDLTSIDNKRLILSLFLKLTNLFMPVNLDLLVYVTFYSKLLLRRLQKG